MKNRIALCWKCKIFYLIVIAFLVGIFILLYRVSTPIPRNVTVTVSEQAAAKNKQAPAEKKQAETTTPEYYATYDLFNKHFTLLFTVFGVLISLFGVIVPLAFYFYQQNQFKDKIQRIKDKFTFHQERLKQDLSDSNKNEISLLKSEIEKQREDLEIKIEKEIKKQTSEFSEDFEAAYMDMSVIILRLYGSSHKKDYSKNDFLADLFRLLSSSLNHSFRSKKDENIVAILKTMISVEIPKTIDKDTHDLFMKKLPEIEAVIERHPELKEDFREKLLKPIINAEIEDDPPGE